jgi:DNA-binding NtrC family response regulator
MVANIENWKEASQDGAGLMNAADDKLIMVVDDDDSVRLVIRRILELAGFSVLAVASGRTAVEQAKRLGEKLGLVVLDMVMPNMNGYATFQALQEAHPGLPCVLCSGDCETAEVRDLMQTGHCDFIPKPFSRTQLNFAINRMLPKFRH